MAKVREVLRTRPLAKDLVLRYGVVVCSCASVLLLSIALSGVVTYAPFALFLAAIMVSAWYGGVRTGLLATLFGVVAIDYFFLPPAGLAIRSWGSLLELVIFALSGVIIVWLDFQRARAVGHSEFVAGRLARVQDFTASLARAASPPEVADILLQEAGEILAARAAALAVVSDDGNGLEIVRVAGAESTDLNAGQRWPADAQNLMVEALRAGDLVSERLTTMTTGAPGSSSHAAGSQGTRVALPLIVKGHTVGALALSFDAAHSLVDSDIQLLRALSSQGGQALERAHLYEREHAARLQAEVAESHLQFLADASQELSSSLEYEETLSRVAELAVRTLCDWTFIDLVQPNSLPHRVAGAHRNPEKRHLVGTLIRDCANEPSALEGAALAIREGRSLLYETIPSELLQSRIPDEKHEELVRELNPVSAMILPLLARGKVLGAITFVASESGRHFSEADLSLAQELASRAAMAVDNARLYQEVQQALLTREDFLAAAAHDLNNPLASIKLRAYLLERRVGQMATDEGLEIIQGLEEIQRTASRMAAVTRELLDLASLEMGNPIQLDLGPTDLVALARDIVDEFNQATELHVIVMNTPVTSLVGEWDASRLSRVLSNLLSNAVKYSPKGGQIEVEIDQEVDQAGAWATVAVRDHGIGIPSQELAHVFERFRRGNNVGGKIRGTGIGLTSVRHFVEQHGGTVSVQSEEGSGSCFTVRLPLQPAEDRPATSGKPYVNLHADQLDAPKADTQQHRSIP